MLKFIKQFVPDSHGTLRVPWLTLALAGFMVALYLAETVVFSFSLFDKTLIAQGEWWRFVTGHFVHCNFEHLFWDLLAFVILGGIIEIHSRRELMFSLLISCLGVSAWLTWGDTTWTTYCGLSGALNGLLFVAAIKIWQKTGDKIYIAVLIVTVLKMVYEFTTHQTIFTDLGSQAVPSAHAAGFVAGALYFVYSNYKNSSFKNHSIKIRV
ncbi:MAG: rhombosortase [Candidatus Omnitrophica bacterium]|nr:rhombosortase [Candidatus Omnitrophota bacterium]